LYTHLVMYTPPHLKHLQTSNGGNHSALNRTHSNSGNNSALNRQQSTGTGYNNSPLGKMFGRLKEDNEPKTQSISKPKQQSLSDYNNQVKSKHELLIKNIQSDKPLESRIITISSVKMDETVADKMYSKPADFWSDIYNFTKDPELKVNLSWNHSISKDAMIKLLQEQGIIKFNPIQYYQNTIESQENHTKTITDKLRVNISRAFIKYLSPLTIHNINITNIQEMISIAQDTIEASRLSETEKLDFIDIYRKDLTEYLQTKKNDLAFKYGFKYKQHLKFLEDSLEILEDEKELTKIVKPVLSDKIKKSILDIVLADKGFNYKDLAALDKIVKKEFKFISNLPCDQKYFTRLCIYNIIHNILDAEHDSLEKTSKTKSDTRLVSKYVKIINDFIDKMEKLEYILRAKLHPVLDNLNTEKVDKLEKELELFEYSNMKERIIGERFLAQLEQDKKNDEAILEAIKNHDYERPSILELANYIHSVHIEKNKIPTMIRLLELFTKYGTSNGLPAYVEAYTFIVDYINSNSVEYAKVDEELKKKYTLSLERAQIMFSKTGTDIYEYQMTNLYEYLSPLSHFDEKRPKLDKWQKDVFEMMDNRKNVIVIAPTSSGKTALSTYCSLIANKVMFVVPSSELARQVCGMIRNLVLENNLKKHISLVTEKDTYHDSPSGFDILVGTPGALEMYFVDMNINTDMFDYIVFDEIHQLNQEVVGAELERWIKWLTHNTRTKFLALSACVGNAEQLRDWWLQFVDDIELVVCNRRFLQQQKYLWSDSKHALDKIHPLTVCSLEFLQGDGFIQDGVVRADVAFTPDDLYNLYSNIRSHPSFKTALHPDKYFKSIRLTLETCKEWEWALKEQLQELAKTDSVFVETVLNNYSGGLEESIAESNVEDLYKLLKDLQAKNMLPSILFRLDPSICQQKFTELVMYLKKEESIVYPYYYDDLKFAQEFYEETLVKEKEIDDIDIPEGLDVQPHVYIEQRKIQVKNKQTSAFIKKFNEIVGSRIIYTRNLISEIKDNMGIDQTIRDVAVKNYNKQIKYYEKEIKRVDNINELCPVNIYKPHPEFTFLEEYINSDHIIEYRRQLMDYIREEKKAQHKLEKSNNSHAGEDDSKDIRKEAYISYDHPFMIGMERGVILYLNRLPTPFQRVAQSLIASTTKLAPVTFSDQSLAFGVNYPIRSVILTGGAINPIVAHQMIGRAGRRGVDPKGYTIYYGVDWKTIIKEKYLEVKGSDSIDGTVWSMPFLWINIQDKFELVAKYHLKDFTEGTDTLQKSYETFMEDIHKMYSMFKSEYDIELLESGAYSCMLADVYANKHLGISAVFLPYMLEELSRWKLACNKLDSSDKWNIIQVLTAFLNNDFKCEAFSEQFRKKTGVWHTNVGHILEKYKPTVTYMAVRLEDKITESSVPYWFSISELLSALHSLCKDRRIKTVIGLMYLDIKNRLKKYTF
jgi:hypothetical protein